MLILIGCIVFCLFFIALEMMFKFSPALTVLICLFCLVFSIFGIVDSSFVNGVNTFASDFYHVFSVIPSSWLIQFGILIILGPSLTLIIKGYKRIKENNQTE
ncbi:hypothetical protein ACTHP5_20420 [Bacillus subtilis]|uniref:hypothetical protein n=1 Tax=Bacillus TaxID=1386 RepID=UPI000F54B859|nr:MULTISPECIES: hypothetical protein [Bacillus]MEC2294246.1 hypothetical protein [Bacillus subtilis]MEC3665001.1 hypothetical protein [Bacillus subtilis]NUF07838.1 hypothetical protein [Bacillus rugosus]